MRPPVSLARLWTVCAVLALASCTGASGGPTPGPTLTVGPVPVVLSTDLAVGQSRFVFQLLDGRTGESVAVPGEEVRVAFYDLDRSRTAASAHSTGVFAWLEVDREGAFVTAVNLSAAGSWEAEIQPDGARSSRVGFQVREQSLTPRIGARAPASFTRTVRDVGGRLEELTSDPHPLRRFYTRSILQAISEGIPFVVVFGSPRHCSSSGCGHMLDVAKRVAADVAELTFIHVELYRDSGEANPQQLDPAVGEWGLPSEPWMFVVNGRGRVSAKYERVVLGGELREAITALYG